MSVKAIVGATLIDGSGKKPVSDSAVVVRGEKIEAVGKQGDVKVPEGAEVIDASGKWLLPGLIDLHVHLYSSGFVPVPTKGSELAYAGLVASNNLRTALQTGITTLRCVSDRQHIDLAMRDAVERRQIIGPRLLCAGVGICMTGGHGSGIPDTIHEVDGPWAVRKAVREEVKAGVDFIKLLSSHRTDDREFTYEEIEAGVDEAHAHGRKCAIHLANFVGTKMAAEAGVDTIEHGSFIDKETAEKMAYNKIVLVPTLWVKNHIPERTRKTRAEQAKTGIWNLTGRDLEQTEAWFNGCVEQLPQTMKLVMSKKVRIGAGTDNVFGDQMFATLPEEIEWLTKYGVGNMDAIESATRVGAEAIGVEKVLGTISAGKYADMIMVKEDPVKDITALKRVGWVMKGGDVIGLYPEWRRRPIQDPQDTR
ncbi:TPA: amidohydrolase family protein [Candidatus Bathyarchaeota archaeon]|nr:amidohydrolase family protein [Candidatus Bathyarchaeota archaeon]